MDAHHGNAIVLDIEVDHGLIRISHMYSCCNVLVSAVNVSFAMRNNIPYLAMIIGIDPAGVNAKTATPNEISINSLFIEG